MPASPAATTVSCESRHRVGVHREIEELDVVRKQLGSNPLGQIGIPRLAQIVRQLVVGEIHTAHKRRAEPQQRCGVGQGMGQGVPFINRGIKTPQKT